MSWFQELTLNVLVGPGSIISITSLSSAVCAPFSINYTASKFAAKGIIKCAGKLTQSLTRRQWQSYINKLRC